MLTLQDSQIYPLSSSEAECFGWPPGQLVCWCRGPDGRRVIPTRELLSNGECVYGSVETMEPPPHCSEVFWASQYGSWTDCRPGALM